MLPKNWFIYKWFVISLRLPVRNWIQGCAVCSTKGSLSRTCNQSRRRNFYQQRETEAAWCWLPLAFSGDRKLICQLADLARSWQNLGEKMWCLQSPAGHNLHFQTPVSVSVLACWFFFFPPALITRHRCLCFCFGCGFDVRMMRDNLKSEEADYHWIVCSSKINGCTSWREPLASATAGQRFHFESKCARTPTITHQTGKFWKVHFQIAGKIPAPSGVGTSMAMLLAPRDELVEMLIAAAAIEWIWLPRCAPGETPSALSL